MEALAKEGVASVAAGDYHSLAVTAEGALFSFGYGGFGQLGHGDTAHQWLPKRLAGLAKERVASVAAGQDHSLALTVEGALFSFGRGTSGQLGAMGHADTANRLQPKRVAGLICHGSAQGADVAEAVLKELKETKAAAEAMVDKRAEKKACKAATTIQSKARQRQAQAAVEKRRVAVRG